MSPLSPSTYRRVKIATIVAAWILFVVAAILQKWWLVLAGVVPYLVWNQVPRGDPSTETEVTRDLARSRAAAVILAFLDGSCKPYDWDDFTSVRHQDPLIETARRRCVEIHDQYPPETPGRYCNNEGLELLRAIADELSGHAA